MYGGEVNEHGLFLSFAAIDVVGGEECRLATAFWCPKDMVTLSPFSRIVMMRCSPPLPIAPPSASVDVRALLDALHHQRIRVGFGIGSGIKLGIGIILSPVILFAAYAAIVRILVLATDWQTADLMWSRIEVIWRQVGAWFVGTG